MTTEAISALDAEQARALELFRSLSAEEWAAPSDCAGWRVQDVAAHMGAVFHTIADPGSIDGGSSPDVEANAEVPVGARKDWTSAEVLADYEEWSAKGREALVALQGQGVATTVVPLANLGSHPLHLLANALVFDHYCHLRWDIAAPNGPVARDLPQDPAVLTETMTWMLAGLPQMCTDALSVVDRPVTLVFDGPGGGRLVAAATDRARRAHVRRARRRRQRGGSRAVHGRTSSCAGGPSGGTGGQWT